MMASSGIPDGNFYKFEVCRASATSFRKIIVFRDSGLEIILHLASESRLLSRIYSARATLLTCGLMIFTAVVLVEPLPKMSQVKKSAAPARGDGMAASFMTPMVDSVHNGNFC